MGSDEWLGYNAIIMPRANIKNNVVITFESIATKDVPIYCIVKSNAVALVRKRFDNATISKLEQRTYWTCPMEKIQ